MKKSQRQRWISSVKKPRDNDTYGGISVAGIIVDHRAGFLVSILRTPDHKYAQMGGYHDHLSSPVNKMKGVAFVRPPSIELLTKPQGPCCLCTGFLGRVTSTTVRYVSRISTGLHFSFYEKVVEINCVRGRRTEFRISSKPVIFLHRFLFRRWGIKRWPERECPMSGPISLAYCSVL
jgi:hypothetical protein